MPHSGELLAGYRIERRLGRGATGVVYLARQVALDRPVAMKVVGAPFAGDEAFRARFRHEARAAAALDHPNVVTVLDSGEDDQRLWLAMRLVDGPDLRVLLRRTGRLEPAHAVSIVEQVAAALDAAHAAGLVHRDVKPGNVLVEDGPGGALHAELADFGLAGAPRVGAGADGEGSVPGTAPDGAAIEGTPEYAAPEQLAGQPATAAADVYGLGRVFAEMLTGDPATPVGPAANGFAAVVARATDPDPAWRYPTAGALAVAARAVLEPEAARTVGTAAGVAGRLPSPAELEDDDVAAEYEPVVPLDARGARPSRRRATTLVASRRRRRRWFWALPLVALVAVVAALALVSGELRNELLAGETSERPRAAAPPVPSRSGGAAGGRTTGASSDRDEGSGASSDRTEGPGMSPDPDGDSGASPDRDEGPGASPDAAEGPGASSDRDAGPGMSPDPAEGSAASSAPQVPAAGPGATATAAAFPPARGRQRFGGGSWALDLPSSSGWRQTAVQELSGGRTVLTRLRRDDGTRLVVEHRPGQTAVFGPWPGQPFVVRTPAAGRLDALLFRGGRYAMCREAVCGAVPVNGPSGGVLLIAAATSDARARRELRRAARGLRVG